MEILIRQTGTGLEKDVVGKRCLGSWRPPFALYSLREIILISGVPCRRLYVPFVQGVERRETQKRKRVLGLRSRGHVCGLLEVSRGFVRSCETPPGLIFSLLHAYSFYNLLRKVPIQSTTSVQSSDPWK